MAFFMRIFVGASSSVKKLLKSHSQGNASGVYHANGATGGSIRHEVNMGIPAFVSPEVLILSHQRSGTHMLLASLMSHPQVRSRGECVLGYRTCLDNHDIATLMERAYIYSNRADRVNIGIVMYSAMAAFAELGGSLETIRKHPLLRDPHKTARSCLALRASRAADPSVKSQYTLDERQPTSHVSVDSAKIVALAGRIAALQAYYKSLLVYHPHVLSVSYEELTHDRQVNTVPEEVSDKLLVFLGLPLQVLTNPLQKTFHVRPHRSAA